MIARAILMTPAALVLFFTGRLLADAPATQPGRSLGAGLSVGTNETGSPPTDGFVLDKAWRGQQFVLLAKDAAAAVFSPDGRQIGYVRQKNSAGLPRPAGPLTLPPTPQQVDNSVVVVDLTTGVSREAGLNNAAPKRVEYLVWSADGQMLFAADGEQLWAVSIRGKELEPRVLANPIADGDIRGLALAGDHNHLICRYLPKVRGPAAFAWQTSDFVVLGKDGKQIAQYRGKDGGRDFSFSAKDYLAASGRPGLPPRDGYAWGIVPLARTNDGAEIVVLREEPARSDVLPLADGLRTELASWTGKPGLGAYSKLDQFAEDAAHGTTIEYRATAQANKVLRVRAEGYFTMWGGSRKGTYGVRGKEEKVFVSILDAAVGKFGTETELPMPAEEKASGVNYRPAYELMDFSGDGRLAVLWYYFNYRGDANDRKLSGLAVADRARGICKTISLPHQIYIDRLHPPRVQPRGQLLLFTSANNVWLCDPEAKGNADVTRQGAAEK